MNAKVGIRNESRIKLPEILFITTKSPLPMNDGHSLRSCNIIKQLAKDFDIHLLSFVKSSEEQFYIPELEEICKSVQLIEVAENKSFFKLFFSLVVSVISGKAFVVYKYNKKEMHQCIKDIVKKLNISLVHLDMLPLGVYVKDIKGCNLVLDEHNVESALLKRRVKNEKKFVSKLFYKIQQQRLERFEKDVTSKVDHILACSDIDKDLLSSFSATPITVIPNGVDIEFFRPATQNLETKNSLVFVGGLDWFPNLDAVTWFDGKILPLILEDFPQISLHVIGNKSSIDAVKLKHPASITFHGRVEDVRPFISRATLFVVPLRIGGGTRLKILNAMAMKKCVVSTSIGAEGLGAMDGENIVIADTSQDFAEKIRQCLNAPEYSNTIGEGGYTHILENFQWDAIGNDLRKVYHLLSKTIE
ncbi:MAG: glycosyltransferase [Desulfopila sp.]